MRSSPYRLRFYASPAPRATPSQPLTSFRRPLFFLACIGALPGVLAVVMSQPVVAEEQPPNIIFVMADDMGWGQTGYQDHPVLKTPNLDAMAAAGVRFDRFYAGCPVCSPTRASVLTGRSPDRTGVVQHGYALRHQEKTIATALQQAGYVTGHFGKWHLNGLRGPGVPILADDQYHPGRFGFDRWISVTNFFDVDPLMSRMGQFEQYEGDSSEVVVDQAIAFLDKHRNDSRPMFAVIWYGTPHSPFKAADADKAAFTELDDNSANHYGELVAMDRSLGNLRGKLREFGIAENTLLVFCSDNGGLPRIEPDTVGGLRGHKGTVYEGGLRVPAIFEWPSKLDPRVTSYPACTMDLFPTVADCLDLPRDVFVEPLDGVSLIPALLGELERRDQPIPFRFGDKSAWVDNDFKLVTNDYRTGEFELYDLKNDPTESNDLRQRKPDRYQQMTAAWHEWNRAVDASFAGEDYPAGELQPADPEPVFWFRTEAYQPYLSDWKERWEYRRYIERLNRDE